MLETIAGIYIALSIVPIVLGGLAVAYIGLRIRDSRSETPDPELGIKCAYHAFMTAGILLALTGLTISAVDFLAESLGDKPLNQPGQFVGPPGPFGPQPQFRAQPKADEPFDRLSQRIAWPLVISGCLCSLISLLLIKAGTNDDHFPAVRRAFGGLKLVVEGLNVMAGITVLIELLFQKEIADARPFSIALGLLVVWFPAAVIQVFFLRMYIKLPYYVPPKAKDKKPIELEESDEDDEPSPRERRRPPRLPREREEGEE